MAQRSRMMEQEDIKNRLVYLKIHLEVLMVTYVIKFRNMYS